MTTANTPQKPPTTEELAQQKNVPISRDRPDGTYTLLAVIEGAQANARFSHSVNVVNAQRQKIGKLKQEFGALPISAQQQREYIAGEINKTEATLKQNLGFLQTNFGYNLSHNYLLMPERAQLQLVDQQKKQIGENLHEFANAEDYMQFQKSSSAYQQRLNTLLNEWAQGVEPDENGKKVIQPEALQTLKSEDEDLCDLKDELAAAYSFDPEKSYNVCFEKSALYFKPATR